MRNLILLALLLISTAITAQFSVSVSTLSGYETNINKKPESYNLNNVLIGKEKLHKNSFYQEAILKLNYKNKWNSNEFRAYLTPEIKYYFTEANAKKVLFNSGIRYNHGFSKNVKWITNVRYKIKDQKGQDLDEPELNTPRGYNVATINTGVLFKLYKNNRTTLRASYDLKNFDKSDTRKIMYHRYGVYAKFENRNKINNNTHRYGIIASYQNRNYNLDYFTTNVTKYRTWKYLNLGAYYKIPLNTNLSISPALSYEKRTDITQKKYGYNQIRPSLGFNYKNERLYANLNLSYSNRKFESLKANTKENLKYNYTRVKFKGNYQLTESLDVISDLYLLGRKTNNNNVSTKAYRSYNNNYAGLGVRYNF